MDANAVSIPLAFLAGLLSFISPCVMPLIPAYIGYLSGTTFGVAGADGQVVGVNRQTTFLHAVFFVLGFSVVFVLLGASVGFVGLAAYRYLPAVQKAGGVLVILFGLHTLGLIRIPLLYQEKRMEIPARPGLGYLSSSLMGVAFSVGWVPCVGPILTAILLLASNTQTVGRGAFLLAVYSLGLGIPFLLTGAAFGTASAWLRKMRRYLPIISVISGIFLIVIGVLVITDSFRLLSGLGPIIDVGVY